MAWSLWEKRCPRGRARNALQGNERGDYVTASDFIGVKE